MKEYTIESLKYAGNAFLIVTFLGLFAGAGMFAAIRGIVAGVLLFIYHMATKPNKRKDPLDWYR